MAYQPKLRKPATQDRLRSGKKPYTRKIGIVLDTEVVERYEEASQEFERAETAARVAVAETARKEASERLSAAQAVLDLAAKEVEETVAVMTFRSIGRKKYDEMLLRHPPTDLQLAEAKTKNESPPTYNEESFSRELIRVSCVDPALDPEFIDEIFDGYDPPEGSDEEPRPAWNSSEITRLWVAALEVNSQVQVPDLGKA